jgi:Cu(I)/Ag(I) efflux system membrane fusion protein
MKKFIGISTVFFLGAAAGTLVTYMGYPVLDGIFGPSTVAQGKSLPETERKPLYWVAPMDLNYRRDKPGKSPMGMDLIPFYGDDDSGPDGGPGTVKITPDVVNNLGVKTDRVQRGSLSSEIQTVGYIDYDEDQLVNINPRVKGWIEKLYVKASGDPVTKGEPLYDIYSPELVNAQEELMMALARNKPRLIRAAENRLASLRVPASVIKQLRITREVKQTITFYAPQSGVVDNLNIRQGFYVKPGSTIMSIGSLEQVWVEAEVFESQASDVAVGLPVSMTLDYLPGKEWRGVVDYVYPTLNAKTRTVRVRLRFDNDQGLLRPDMFAQVVIHQNSPEKTLLVPREAVIRTGRSSRVVLALGDGRFKSINVKVGRFDERSAEILSGLSEGEYVVTSAQFLIDSESSKTSDFKRMSHTETAAPTTVWVEATINSLMADDRKINASHKAIRTWDWPEMTMDFAVDDGVDLTSFETGMTLHLEITKMDRDRYLITDVRVPGAGEEKKSLDDLNMDDMDLDDMSLEDTGPSQHKT